MRRFTLRSLLVFTAVLALLVALPIERAVKQKRGRAWVASQGGHVTFSHKHRRADGEYDHDAVLQAPIWLIDLLGIDFFDSVETVVLDNTVVTDLSPIVDLCELERLSIFIEIDDQLDFSPLTDLPRLKDLYLDYTDISAQRLADLRALLPHVRVDATNHAPPD